MNKFWNYESGFVKIDEQCLYDFLTLKGIMYFKSTNDNYKYIVVFLDNKVDLYFIRKLWRFCCLLIDKEFTSVTVEERTLVKKALKKIKKSLKKGNLSQFRIEDLENCKENEAKKFLKALVPKSDPKKGGTVL